MHFNRGLTLCRIYFEGFQQGLFALLRRVRDKDLKKELALFRLVSQLDPVTSATAATLEIRATLLAGAAAGEMGVNYAIAPNGGGFADAADRAELGRRLSDDVLLLALLGDLLRPAAGGRAKVFIGEFPLLAGGGIDIDDCEYSIKNNR